jgi:hypothetical protein
MRVPNIANKKTARRRSDIRGSLARRDVTSNLIEAFDNLAALARLFVQFRGRAVGFVEVGAVRIDVKVVGNLQTGQSRVD